MEGSGGVSSAVGQFVSADGERHLLMRLFTSRNVSLRGIETFNGQISEWSLAQFKGICGVLLSDS